MPIVSSYHYTILVEMCSKYKPVRVIYIQVLDEKYEILALSAHMHEPDTDSRAESVCILPCTCR